ncbi:unnamed protein product [Pleuronectes platessa]|uniref:Uncharacterized protein n=1 Tax=Pleuronectes platessa TaxID=8262 RepID=A0A9N7VAN5_PLEPL|nr:unnamed protein product [Pleuronectes platessa]
MWPSELLLSSNLPSSPRRFNGHSMDSLRFSAWRGAFKKEDSGFDESAGVVGGWLMRQTIGLRILEYWICVEREILPRSSFDSNESPVRPAISPVSIEPPPLTQCQLGIGSCPVTLRG